MNRTLLAAAALALAATVLAYAAQTDPVTGKFTIESVDRDVLSVRDADGKTASLKLFKRTQVFVNKKPAAADALYAGVEAVINYNPQTKIVLRIDFPELKGPLKKAPKKEPEKPAPEEKFVELKVNALRVGAEGCPVWIHAKIIQIIDEKSMLIGLENSQTGLGRYPDWVLLKCDTKGLVDGRGLSSSQLMEVAGSKVLRVTGTHRYNTVGGGTKTVFVLEPVLPKKK